MSYIHKHYTILDRIYGPYSKDLNRIIMVYSPQFQGSLGPYKDMVLEQTYANQAVQVVLWLWVPVPTPELNPKPCHPEH